MTMPGGVTNYEGKTDGVSHMELEPGWLNFTTKLGLHKSSTMPKDEATLIVAVKGATASTKDGVTINVDGKKTVLSAIDDLSDMDSNGFFRKRYPIKVALIREMVNGKSVWVKINHTGQTYSEGEFSKGGSMSAKTGFTEFLAKSP
jgi:hypothetical protein